MKNIILPIVVLLFLINTKCFAQKLLPSQVESLVWQTDLMQAHQLSQSTNKPIFAFFTGSDWCGWCHKLQREVFAKADFINWAKKNVILLEVDFPRAKQLPKELAQQNAGLQQQFQVQGYPTIWMFFTSKDPKENKFSLNPLGSLGYPSGAERGREELKFLKDADLVLANSGKK